MKSLDWLVRWTTVLGLVLTVSLCGCATTGGGGGGGDDAGDDDPLPEFQLGEDEELDADVGAITTADNAAVVCVGGTTVFTDEDVLLALKTTYVADPEAAATFEEFVADIAAIQTNKSDQICNTELGDNEDLDTAIQDITDAANRAAECDGNEADATIETTLPIIKALFLEAGRTETDLVAYAQSRVDLAEQQADEACGEG